MSECKHRGSYNISPTSTAKLQTSLLLFIFRTIAGQEALGDRVRSFTPSHSRNCSALVHFVLSSQSRRLESFLDACIRK